MHSAFMPARSRLISSVDFAAGLAVDFEATSAAGSAVGMARFTAATVTRWPGLRGAARLIVG